MKTTAVIVARKGSVRIPNKMHQIINGESLVMRKVRQCLATPGIHEVVVGSDDVSIAADVIRMGAKFAHRELKYCDEKSTTVNDMVRNMLNFIDTDQVLWAHPTNPFITEHHYKQAIDLLDENRVNGKNSLFSVNVLKGHFWDDRGKEINFDSTAKIHRVAADLPPIYAQNGGIFIRPYADMLVDGALVSASKAVIYQMDALDGWDIDHSWQLEFAQHYAAKNNL